MFFVQYWTIQCLNVSVLQHLCCCWIPSNLLAGDVRFAEGGVDSLPMRFKIKRGKRFKAVLKSLYFIKSFGHVLHSLFLCPRNLHWYHQDILFIWMLKYFLKSQLSSTKNEHFVNYSPSCHYKDFCLSSKQMKRF